MNTTFLQSFFHQGSSWYATGQKRDVGNLLPFLLMPSWDLVNLSIYEILTRFVMLIFKNLVKIWFFTSADKICHPKKEDLVKKRIFEFLTRLLRGRFTSIIKIRKYFISKSLICLIAKVPAFFKSKNGMTNLVSLCLIPESDKIFHFALYRSCQIVIKGKN